MKIIFKAGYTPEGQAPDRPTYEAGKIYEFNGFVAESYARKYVDRGLAEVAVAKPEPKAAETKLEEPEKPVKEPEPVAVEAPKQEAPAEEPEKPVARKGRTAR